MTPGARVAAAIEVLDGVLDGTPAEQALTRWARNSRFAGSKDRAAVRDHVFDVLRAKRSLGDGDGRSLMIALTQREGLDIAHVFNGEGYAPQPVEEKELGPKSALTEAARHDLPDWLWPVWLSDLGAQAKKAALIQQSRAPVSLRVNLRRCTVDKAIDQLEADDVKATSHATVKTALTVSRNPRRVNGTKAYTEGLVELQDIASQWAVGKVAVPKGARILDYCAGGGGKALAFADLYDCQVVAHDIDPQRMKDIPPRAARAGVSIKISETSALNTEDSFDVVFCDAPCSGSGTWRRTPQSKWQLAPESLDQFHQTQRGVLCSAARFVADDGVLIYATCSVLCRENEDVLRAFQASEPEWALVQSQRRIPDAQGDGFFFAVLQRK